MPVAELVFWAGICFQAAAHILLRNTTLVHIRPIKAKCMQNLGPVNVFLPWFLGYLALLISWEHACTATAVAFRPLTSNRCGESSTAARKPQCCPLICPGYEINRRAVCADMEEKRNRLYSLLFENFLQSLLKHSFGWNTAHHRVIISEAAIMHGKLETLQAAAIGQGGEIKPYKIHVGKLIVKHYYSSHWLAVC